MAQAPAPAALVFLEALWGQKEPQGKGLPAQMALAEQGFWSPASPHPQGLQHLALVFVSAPLSLRSHS